MTKYFEALLIFLMWLLLLWELLKEMFPSGWEFLRLVGGLMKGW